MKEEFENLRQKVGSIIGMAVPPRSAESVILERDRQGVIGAKQMIRLFIALYNFVESVAEKEALAGEVKVKAMEAPVEETKNEAPVETVEQTTLPIKENIEQPQVTEQKEETTNG